MRQYLLDGEPLDVDEWQEQQPKSRGERMAENLSRAHEIWRRLGEIDEDLRLAAKAYERATKALRDEKSKLIQERCAMLTAD